MASMDTSGLDELIREMMRLGQNSGPVAEKMLDAAAEIIREGWKEAAAEHGHIDTGDMVNSVKYDTKDARMLMREIYPHGKDSKGVDNAQKAFILHYGKHNLPGDYWVDDAEMKAGPKAIEACREIWDRFLAGGG
jgi:hypothetical protein